MSQTVVPADAVHPQDLPAAPVLASVPAERELIIEITDVAPNLEEGTAGLAEVFPCK